MKLLIPPPIYATVCAVLMWAAGAYLPFAKFSFVGQSTIAILVCVAGLCLDLISLRLFTKNQTTVSPMSPKDTAQLVTNGLYAYTRNPMYLGLSIILTGIAIWSGSHISFALVLVFVWLITQFQIKPEEEVLLEKFGEDYGAYLMKVRRWI